MSGELGSVVEETGSSNTSSKQQLLLSICRYTERAQPREIPLFSTEKVVYSVHMYFIDMMSTVYEGMKSCWAHRNSIESKSGGEV